MSGVTQSVSLLLLKASIIIYTMFFLTDDEIVEIEPFVFCGYLTLVDTVVFHLL